MSEIDEIVKDAEAPPVYRTDEPSTIEADPEWIGRAHTGTKPKKPSMWHVVLLNDDFTPMEFVVAILVRFFNKGPEEATAIMLEVHQKGKAIAGTYTFEICETKAYEVMKTARVAEHPLMAVVERAD